MIELNNVWCKSSKEVFYILMEQNFECHSIVDLSIHTRFNLANKTIYPIHKDNKYATYGLEVELVDGEFEYVKSELETMKEKYESGEYICLFNKNRPFSQWIKFQDEDIKTLSKLWDDYSYRSIHKKHKDILGAYLEDNNVEIEWCYDNHWEDLKTDFIEEYSIRCNYRLKLNKPKNNFKDFGFEADFEGHIYERDRTYLLGKVRLDCDIKLFRWNYQTGVCREDEKYNLKPIKKEWYENPENFEAYKGKLITNKHNDIRKIEYIYNDCVDVGIECIYHKDLIVDKWRLVTKEEVLKLVANENE